MAALIQRLGRWHDQSSRCLLAAAGAALIAAVGLYVFEVVMRYLFDAPTTWSSDLVQIALALLIFCGLPEITRRNAHIVIDIVPEMLPARAALWLERFNALLGATVCAIAGWIVAGEAAQQFERGLMTNASHPIPRWWITAVIGIGFASAALHFLREAGRRAA